MKQSNIGLKSLDFAETPSSSIHLKNKTSFDSRIMKSSYEQPISTQKKFPEEESTIIQNSARSVIVRNRENSLHTYQKYLKLLDPSFLNDADNENNVKIVKNQSNSHVPTGILKLLPLQRLKNSVTHEYTKKMESIIITNDENEGKTKNPLKNRNYELGRFVKEKIGNEKEKYKRKLKSFNDISNIKQVRQGEIEERANESIMIKDYYKDNDGSLIKEVIKFFILILSMSS